MISTKQPVTKTLSLEPQKFSLPRKKQLVARWRTVDNQLICQWVLA